MLDLTRASALKVLQLTAMGRRSGLHRTVELWFVHDSERLYVMAEGLSRTGWVRNLIPNPTVSVVLGDNLFQARARVLSPIADVVLYRCACRLFQEKYGWSEGLPVELAPLVAPDAS